MPIRAALAALPLLVLLFLFTGAPAAHASGSETRRTPAAALVTPASDVSADDGPGVLSGPGLAVLVAACFIPALVLLTRRKQRS